MTTNKLANYLSLSAAAKRLHLASANLYLEIENGSLRATKVGKTFFINPEDLEAWSNVRIIPPRYRKVISNAPSDEEAVTSLERFGIHGDLAIAVVLLLRNPEMLRDILELIETKKGRAGDP